MEIITKKYLTNGQYLTHQEYKKSIFLHHTISTNAMSAWRWWNSTPERVGTPYIIDRDGSILECFDPSMWAFHLGVRRDDNWQEIHSIPIELVAAGPIRLINGENRFYPLWPNKLRYTTIPSEEVIEMDNYKGHDLWHNYSEEQLESLKWLIGRLYMDFTELEIRNDMGTFYEYNEEVITKHMPGIWAHSTVRKDKSDIIPTPDLIKALKEVQEELIVEPKPKSKPKPTSILKPKKGSKTKHS